MIFCGGERFVSSHAAASGPPPGGVVTAAGDEGEDTAGTATTDKYINEKTFMYCV